MTHYIHGSLTCWGPSAYFVNISSVPSTLPFHISCSHSVSGALKFSFSIIWLHVDKYGRYHISTSIRWNFQSRPAFYHLCLPYSPFLSGPTQRWFRSERDFDCFGSLLSQEEVSPNKVWESKWQELAHGILLGHIRQLWKLVYLSKLP